MKKNSYILLITLLSVLFAYMLSGCSEESEQTNAPPDKGTLKFINQTTGYSINWIEINGGGNLLKQGETIAAGKSWSVHVDPGKYTYFLTGIRGESDVVIWDNDGEAVTVEKGKTLAVDLKE
ncbi:hypothetical protein JXB12_03530 [candidate division KSB1 bacterium]|nr:hypothetical protein [candidate division KSB1 bacterium]